MICDCKICIQCIKFGYSSYIKEAKALNLLRKFGCLSCEKPDFTNDDSDAISDHIVNISEIIKTHLRENYDEFMGIVAQWGLNETCENFRWCSHCPNGFEGDPDEIKMKCNNCNQYTCFNCKVKWEPEHEDRTCDDYNKFLKERELENEKKMVDDMLKDNNIICPNCHMKYDLAKGGCLHFTCMSCKFEFCAGCRKALSKDSKKGLNGQHSRNCISFLRDYSVGQLLQLLSSNKIDVGLTEQNSQKCLMIETDDNLQERKCGSKNKFIKQLKISAGLCEKHLKERLVNLINKNKIEVVSLLTKTQLETCIKNRYGKYLPKVGSGEKAKDVYMEFIKKEIPLDDLSNFMV